MPDSFPEIFRRKTSRKLKNKKKTKTIFQRYWKAEKCKTKKPRENQKTKKNKVLGRGGVRLEFQNIFFFGFFGFLEVFLVLHFSAFQDLWKIVFFYFFWFFWFSRGFCTFSKGPSPKILKMSFLICSSRLYFSFVYCYAFFGRNSALMLLFFISCVAFHI